MNFWNWLYLLWFGQPTQEYNCPVKPLKNYTVFVKFQNLRVQNAVDFWVKTINKLDINVGVIQNHHDSNSDFVVHLGAHTDYPFDYTTLAYSLSCSEAPNIQTEGACGDIFINPRIPWAEKDSQLRDRFDLTTVVGHELLHSLGINHISNKKALMYPSYTGVHRYLHSSDKTALESVYGCA